MGQAGTQWQVSKPLNVPRAYASAVTAKNGGIIYVMGGLSDYQIVMSIESFDPVANQKWNLLNVNMPSRIIKFGAAVVNSNEVLIAGGIYGDQKNDYSYVNTVYRFDLYSQKWTILPKMSQRRVMSNHLPYIVGQNDAKVYCIGGSFDSTCEAFNLQNGKWEPVAGFEKLIRDNDLQTFSVGYI